MDDLQARQVALVGLTDVIAAGQTYRLAAAVYFGLNAADTHAITFLDVRGPMPQTTLARLMGLTGAGATALVDRLETAQIARRSPDPGDRRKYRIELTRRARNLIDESTARLLRVFDGIDPTTLSVLGEAWAHVGAGLEREAQDLRDHPTRWEDPASDG